MNEQPDQPDLRELGHDLPWDRPDAARRDAVRSALLVAAAEGHGHVRSRWLVVGAAFTAGALAAAAAILLVVRPHRDVASAPQIDVAQIEASAAADFERHVTQTQTGADEVVRVRAGRISMKVGELRAGNRVRVGAANGEVEGQGAYDVVVVDDALREVDVKDGSVTVRVAGQRDVFLASGQTWKATVTTAAIDLPPAAPPSPPVAPAPPGVAPTPPPPTTDKPIVVNKPASADKQVVANQPAPSDKQVAATKPASPTDMPPPATDTPVAAPATEAPAVATETPKRTGPTDVEKHFQAGWQLLKAGKAAEAARELGASADAGGDDPLAADARYFQAVALVKAGRKTEAEKALVAFLDHAPKALRRGRAAVMLARLIAERGDTASARNWFQSALGDPDPSVVAAAKAGLASFK
jgi:TolA-binding protein